MTSLFCPVGQDRKPRDVLPPGGGWHRWDNFLVPNQGHRSYQAREAMPTLHETSMPLRHAAHCSTCALRPGCMPQGLSANDTEKLEAVIVNARTIKRGETLFRIGDTFDTLYAIRSGSIKTAVSSANGREHVMGLHLGGDTLGLEGFDEGRHACRAVALEDSSVCVIPYAPFERACRETSAIQRRLLQLLSHEVVRKSTQTLILGTLRADERVAALLL